MSDRLGELAARLDGLDDLPVAQHPDALEAVQAALVAELDALAGAGRAPRADLAAHDEASSGERGAAGGGVPRP